MIALAAASFFACEFCPEECTALAKMSLFISGVDQFVGDADAIENSNVKPTFFPRFTNRRRGGRLAVLLPAAGKVKTVFERNKSYIACRANNHRITAGAKKIIRSRIGCAELWNLVDHLRIHGVQRSLPDYGAEINKNWPLNVTPLAAVLDHFADST